MHRWVAIPALLLSLAILTQLTGTRCSSTRGKLQVDGIPAALQHILEAGDATGLEAYGEAVGWDAVQDAWVRVERAIHGDTPEQLRASFLRHRDSLGLLSRSLTGAYRSPIYYQDFQLWERSASGPAFRRWQLRNRAEPLFDEGAVPDSIRARELEAILAELHTLGDQRTSLYIEYALDRIYSHRTGPDGDRIRRMIEHAREAGSSRLESQFLGILAAYYSGRGLQDSARVCAARAESLAAACRLTDQQVRFLTWRAGALTGRGRYAAAMEMYSEARDVARTRHASQWELRPLLQSMAVKAEFGAWSALREDLPQARQLLRRFQASTNSLAAETYGLDLDLLELRCAIAVGDPGSDRMLDEVLSRIRHDASRVFTCRVLLDAGESYLAAGRPEGVPAMARRGREWAQEYTFPDYERAFVLLEARARADLGDVEPAAGLVAALDTLLATPWEGIHVAGVDFEFEVPTERDVLAARLRLSQGDLRGASDLAARAVEHLAEHLSEMDGSQESYLDVSRTAALRGLLGRVVGSDPSAGYRLEMAWRSLTSLVGAGNRPWIRRNREDARGAILALLPDRGAGPKTGFPKRPEIPPGTAHWLYAVLPEGLVRWTATPEGVRRERLPTSPAEVTRLAEETTRLLSRDRSPGPGIDPELERHLEALAAALCPDAASLPGGVRLFVSPQGALLNLPFEALDLKPGAGYVPLLSRCDVAYLPFVSRYRRPARRVRAVVVADPTVPGRIRLAHPGLVPLPAARREGAAVADLVDRPTLLQGGSATREALTAVWESADLLHIAAHVVQDPETPYLAFLPLAASPDSADREAPLLEMLDVRRADLRDMSLAVLSGCSTGRVYVSEGSMAPGFGDAFLAAGTAAVVQSFWDVPDSGTVALVEAFYRNRSLPGTDAVHALSEARREVLSENDDPIRWAAFHIAVTRMNGVPPPASHTAD